MDHVLTSMIGFLVPALETCGALIITMAAARTVVQYVYRFFKHGNQDVTPLRIRMGQSMVLALEFLVAADILKTALSPQWNDVLLLAALIGMRTILNYLLERELRMLNADRLSCEVPDLPQEIRR